MLARKMTSLAAAMARQWLPPSILERYQVRRLRMVLRAALATPFYQQKYRGIGLRPRDIQKPSDIQVLPLLTRAEIIDAYPDRICRRPPHPSDVITHTSGSSGRFLNVAHDAAEFDFLDAVYGRALFGTGYKPTDRFAYFWWSDQQAPTIYEKLGLMRKIVLESEADPERQLTALCRVRPHAIYNFPTSMVSIAKLVERRRPPELRPKIIICHGELMGRDSQDYIAGVFGCDVFNQYGAQEFNRMAWDCPRHQGLHVDIDSIFVEILRDGQPVAPHTEGELVVTSLHNTLMPMIRYTMRDVGVLDDRRCDCGRGLPLIHLTGGRIDDYLLLPSGRHVGPRMIVPRIERFHGFRQFRVVQRSLDQIDILIVKEDQSPPQLERNLEALLRELVGDEPVTVKCRAVTEIPLRGRGKLRCVERDPGLTLTSESTRAAAPVGETVPE